MKRTLKLIALLLIIQIAGSAQNNKKVVVMITRANWCPTCRANDNKIKTELVPAYSTSKEVTIVINDITNGRTKLTSKPLLQAEGVLEIAKAEKITGAIAIINPANGQIIGREYVVNNVEVIKHSIREALLKIE